MRRTSWIAGAATVAALAAPSAAQAADTLYGVTADEELVTFSSDAPGNVAVPLAITGLQPGETVLGIDVRPATGGIYALGSTGRVYVIDPRDASARPAFSQVLTLRGDDYGIDFNPAVDKLRLVSADEDNQRINPDTGATVAGTAPDGGDGDVNPAGEVVAAGYSNNVNGRQGASTTALYTIDSAADRLNLQAPPNDGTQAPRGPLGVDVTAAASFDVPAAQNIGYAALEVGGTTGLYTIDLRTGAATLVGPVGGDSPLVGLAAAKQDVPLYGLTVPNGAGAQQLLTFGSAAPRDTNAPQNVPVVATRNITGAPNLVGIDVRPADGRIYGFTVEGDIYMIDIGSGQATRSAVGRVPVTAGAAAFGVDFNPVPDRLRIVDDAQDNFRINPDDASAAGITTDGDVNPAGGLVAAGYTNPFPGATATSLFTVDGDTDTLNLQNPPNNGTQVPQSVLGVDVGDETGFDIAPQDNAAFLVANPAGAARSTLYRLETAAAGGPATAGVSGSTPIGVIGADPAAGPLVRDVTVASAGTLSVAAATARAAESAGTVQVAVRRSSPVGVATVNYAVAAGSASGADVTPATGSVTFNPGETIKSVPVALTDDTTAETPETVTVTLSRAAGGYALGETVTTLTVDDDDPAPAAPGATVTLPGATIPGATVTIPGTTVTIPAPVPGAVPDRGRPVVLVYAPDRRLRTLRASGVPVVVSTNEAARIDLTLRLGDRVIGTGRAVATSPAVLRTQVRLNAAGRRAFSTTRTRRFTATAVVTDVAGNVTTSRAGFRGTATRSRR